MDVQKVRSDKSGLESAHDFSVFYGEKYENHKLGTGLFVHKINQPLREWNFLVIWVSYSYGAKRFLVWYYRSHCSCSDLKQK